MISAFTILAVIQNETVVLSGDFTAFVCSGTPITWSHTRLDGNITHFYKNRNITTEYKQLGFRLRTENDSSERCLVIENARTAIAGKYECVAFEDIGLGVSTSTVTSPDITYEKRQSTELIVLGEIL